MQLKNRGKTNFCFDYNPKDEHVVVGQRVTLYACHGMGQNQVRAPPAGWKVQLRRLQTEG